MRVAKRQNNFKPPIMVVFFEGFINPELIVCCGANSLPEDWSEEWINMDLQVTWGVTREQYNSQYA